MRALGAVLGAALERLDHSAERSLLVLSLSVYKPNVTPLVQPVETLVVIRRAGSHELVKGS